MADPDKKRKFYLTEEQKEFLRQPLLKFEPPTAEEIAAEKAAAEAEKQREKARQLANTKIGDTLPDGSIYAGISPDTGEHIATTPADVISRLHHHQALKCASRLQARGHEDWRLPTKYELNLLYINRVAIGRFSLTGSWPRDCYWSSTPGDRKEYFWMQGFNNGRSCSHYYQCHYSVRCIRSIS